MLADILPEMLKKGWATGQGQYWSC